MNKIITSFIALMM